MKIEYLIGILIILLVALSSCATIETNVVDELPGESGDEVVVISSEEGAVIEEETEETNETNVSALIQEAYEEAGLIENDTEETEEETVTSTNRILIEYFKGYPEDMSIDVGESITWTNMMDNFKHLVIVLPYDEVDQSYSIVPINDLQYILKNDMYTYTFNESGTYKWGSKTRFDKVQGIITVS